MVNVFTVALLNLAPLGHFSSCSITSSPTLNLRGFGVVLIVLLALTIVALTLDHLHTSFPLVGTSQLLAGSFQQIRAAECLTSTS